MTNEGEKGKGDKKKGGLSPFSRRFITPINREYFLLYRYYYIMLIKIRIKGWDSSMENQGARERPLR